MKKNVILLLSLFVMLNIYAKPTAATEENFKHAINNYFKVIPVCLTDSLLSEFPKVIKSTSYTFKKDSAFLNKFIKIGFLTKDVKNEMIDDPRFILSSKKDKKIRIEVITYDLTEKGRKYYKYKITSGLMNVVSGFYIGEAKALNIINFTNPAEYKGLLISRVSFTYSVYNIEDWAKHELFKDETKVIKSLESINNPLKENTTFIQTNNGWIHQKVYQNNF